MAAEGERSLMRLRARTKLVELGSCCGLEAVVWVRTGRLRMYLSAAIRRAERLETMRGRTRISMAAEKATRTAENAKAFKMVADLGLRGVTRAALLLHWRAVWPEITEKVAAAVTVHNFMAKTDRADRPLETLWQMLVATEAGNGIRRVQFRSALALLGFDYQVSLPVFPLTPQNRKTVFFAFLEISRHLAFDPQRTYFFDSSTFVFTHNPRRAWQSKEHRTTFKTSTNFRRFHLMLVLGPTGVFAAQLVLGKMTKGATLSFLVEVVAALRQDGDSLGSVLVLDNARLHKTEDVKALCDAGDTTFLFTAPHSPFMNPVEDAFRAIKAPDRNRHRIDECAHQALHRH